MFGYVNILKDELKIKEFSLFKAYYCGLCKAMGKRFNQLVRLGLNYDFTFLSIILDSVYDEKTLFTKEGCIKSFAKKNIVSDNKAVNYSADMSVILTYYKLRDDIADNHSIKALIASVPYYFGILKLKGKYAQLIEKIKENLKKLSILEKNLCKSIDEAADPFATIMADIFGYASPSLKSLGYHIGRYVYIADACDDFKDDFEKNKYNPLVSAYSYDGVMTDYLRKSLEDLLYMTMTSLAMEYEKLPKFKNKEILDNIIYLGIRAKADNLLTNMMCPDDNMKGKNNNE